MIDRMHCKKAVSPKTGIYPRLAAACLVPVFLGGLASGGHAQLRPGSIDNLPALGEASVDELSPAAEQRLGDQIYQEFLRIGVVHDDPETTDALSRQANRLLSAAGALGHLEAQRPFRFFIVKDPSINAFALPGGYIGIHSGLITASDRESEVMSVLAHEIGHVTQRHIARMFGQQRQSSAVMIAAAVLAAMAARASPDAAMGVMSLGQTVAIRDQLSFSRDAEREADRVGIQILTESGFDPAGMASMFERLSQAGRLYDNNAPAYLRTHPLSTERIADIQGRLQSGAYQSRGQQGNLRPLIAANSTGYDWIRAKLIASADLKVDGLRAARQRLELQLKDPKKSGPATLGPLHFGVSWAALLQRDFVAVAHHLRLAREQAEIGGFVQEVAPFLAHLQIQWAIAANESQLIDTLSQQFFKEFGDHRAMVRALIEARLLAKQPLETTARFARIATQQWPHDPQVWALLARTELASGRRAAQHAAIAEQYVLSGAYAAAIEQLSLARTAGDADFVAMSKIDARLTTIRAILRREQLERQQSNR